MSESKSVPPRRVILKGLAAGAVYIIVFTLSCRAWLSSSPGGEPALVWFHGISAVFTCIILCWKGIDEGWNSLGFALIFLVLTARFLLLFPLFWQVIGDPLHSDYGILLLVAGVSKMMELVVTVLFFLFAMLLRKIQRRNQ